MIAPNVRRKRTKRHYQRIGTTQILRLPLLKIESCRLPRFEAVEEQDDQESFKVAPLYFGSLPEVTIGDLFCPK